MSDVEFSDNQPDSVDGAQASSVTGLNRGEFIRSVLTKAAVAGTIGLGAMLGESFLVPGQAAALSTGIIDSDPIADSGIADTDPSTDTGIVDTDPVADSGIVDSEPITDSGIADSGLADTGVADTLVGDTAPID